LSNKFNPKKKKESDKLIINEENIKNIKKLHVNILPTEKTDKAVCYSISIIVTESKKNEDEKSIYDYILKLLEKVTGTKDDNPNFPKTIVMNNSFKKNIDTTNAINFNIFINKDDTKRINALSELMDKLEKIQHIIEKQIKE
jgi:hypothetical protein